MLPLRLRLAVTVDPVDPAALAWRDQLVALCSNLPEGVAVTGRLPSTQDSYISLVDIADFLEGKVPSARLLYNARAVMLWLVSQWQNLDVVCSSCLLPMDQEYNVAACRCPDRHNTNVTSWWSYKTLDPDHATGDDRWLVSAAGVARLAMRPQDLKFPHRAPTSQRYIRWFLRHVLESRSAAV